MPMVGACRLHTRSSTAAAPVGLAALGALGASGGASFFLRLIDSGISLMTRVS